MNIAQTDNFIASLGVEAYRVGGSVRDELLGRAPKDADYMVRGVSMVELLRILQPHGKVTPLVDRRNQQFGWRVNGIEISLPRRESNAGEGRAQTIEVDPTITLEEDAERRDFTFNALYRVVDGLPFDHMAPATNVIDPTGRGLHDLQKGFIVTTHPHSFRDDPLRTLRALRFVARGFDLGTTTWAQMTEHADKVDGLSASGHASGTVLDEMSKILMGDFAADALRIARDTGVLARLFPELAPMIGFDQQSAYHDMTTDEHTFKALNVAAKVQAPLRVRWSLLFHDSGKPESAWMGDDGRLHFYRRAVVFAKGQEPPITNEDHEIVGERIWREAAERIGAPKALREDVATLIRNHMVPLDGKFKRAKVNRGRVKFGDEMLSNLLLHRACDISGKGEPDQDALERLGRMELARREAQEAGVPSSVGDLAINGNTLMSMGIEGKEIGRTLRLLLDEVVCQPSALTFDPDWQMERACSIAQEAMVSRAVNNRA